MTTSKFDADGLYGANEYPRTLTDVQRDFLSFMKLGWVTLYDFADFVSWAEREFKIDCNK